MTPSRRKGTPANGLMANGLRRSEWLALGNTPCAWRRREDDQPAVKAASFIAYSWSKSLSLAGDRVGYAAVNPESDDAASLFDGMVFANRILGYVNAPATLQLAVLAALSARPDVAWYRKRRDALVSALRDLGLDVAPPDGAFYLFPRSPERDEMPFIERALAERLLVVPGAGFGRRGHFRLSYTVSDQTLEGGIRALARAVGRA